MTSCRAAVAPPRRRGFTPELELFTHFMQQRSARRITALFRYLRLDITAASARGKFAFTRFQMFSG